MLSSPERVAVNPPDRKKQELLDALRQARGNQSEAARILGISRVTVWNRMKQFNIPARGNFNL
jgi:transcriptional regulator of acetoin/glycerol metabolism